MVFPFNTSILEMLQRPVEFALTSLIRMVDHPFSPTLLQRHVQRAQQQFRVQVARHGPADDATV